MRVARLSVAHRQIVVLLVLVVAGVVFVISYLTFPHIQRYQEMMKVLQEDLPSHVLSQARVNDCYNVSNLSTATSTRTFVHKGAGSLPEDFVTYAKRLKSRDKIPIFLMVNKAYISMTGSWLCNVGSMFPGLLEQVMISCTDEETYDRLLASPFGRSVFLHLWKLEDEYRGKLEWDRPLYRRFLLRRVRMNVLLLEAGVSFLQVEPDAVWARDPRPLLHKVIRESGRSDIIGARLGGLSHYRREMISVNFIYLAANHATRTTWNMLERILDHSLYDTYEQQVLDCLCQMKYQNVSCVALRWDLISDGNWYDLRYNERQKFSPYVINNNFIVGIQSKINRVKTYYQWFVDDQSGANLTCANVVINKLRATVARRISGASNDKQWQVPIEWGRQRASEYGDFHQISGNS